VVFDQVIEYRPLPLVAHRVNSRQRSTSVSFGVKRTLTEPRRGKDDEELELDFTWLGAVLAEGVARLACGDARWRT